uniref:histidine kinase n=1 Tax=Geobacter metallireducens TaxID=28232 RepID=A0A831XEU0_GEOME
MARRPFHDISLERKLGRIYRQATAAAFFCSIALFCIIATVEYRAQFMAAAATEGEILAKNLEASLMFDDTAAADALLSSLAGNRNIDAAAVFNAAGDPFAAYQRPDTAPGIRLRPDAPKRTVFHLTHFDFRTGIVATDHINHDRTLGTLTIRYNLTALYNRILLIVVALGGVFVIAFLVGRAVITRRQRSIIGPIEHLTAAANTISASGNYQIRIPVESADEIGVLTESFNDMLEQIRLRDDELQRSRDELEEKVAQRTRELADHTKNLEQINEDLRNFVHIFHHDLRTPILNLSCYVEEVSAAVAAAHRVLAKYESMMTAEDAAALEESLGGETDFSLDVLRGSVSSVKTMYQAVVNISQISTLRARPREFELMPLLQEVADDFRPRIEEAGMALRIGRVPERITSDPAVLRQILSHLLDNAVKFTRDSREKVIGIDGAETEQEWCLGVRDTGIGIAEAEQQKIFDLFRKGDHPGVSGAGMGLSYSRAFAKCINAAIAVQSQEGAGSLFTITIPKPSGKEGYDAAR